MITATNKTEEYVAIARSLLQAPTLDEKQYEEIEDYILKNSLKDSSENFERLLTLMSEVAHKFDRIDITAMREGFGLNSCAQ